MVDEVLFGQRCQQSHDEKVLKSVTGMLVECYGAMRCFFGRLRLRALGSSYSLKNVVISLDKIVKDCQSKN